MKKLSLKDALKVRIHSSLQEGAELFSSYIEECLATGELLYHRKVSSAMDREAFVIAPFEKTGKRMLMFGSNNYLGLATHPYVKQRAIKAIQEFGVGVGGPPLLNGYTLLVSELEKKLARLKGHEDALLFSSGFMTNLGLFTTLPSRRDLVLVDEYHHASTFDALKLGKIPHRTFPHNDVSALSRLLHSPDTKQYREVFVAVEGVYSMHGDLAPLDQIVSLSKRAPFYLIVDDAHGTGVLGKNGAGTAEHFGVSNSVSLSMGTFSKAFAVTGGFVTGSKEIITYLRYQARPYLFSASMPPFQAAIVLASLDLLQTEQSPLEHLRVNCRYTEERLADIGFPIKSQSAIFILPVPKTMSLRRAASLFHSWGVFINAVEYPAVPKGRECFRISLMANHTKQDIDQLIAAIQHVWGAWKDGKL